MDVDKQVFLIAGGDRLLAACCQWQQVAMATMSLS